jgi:hypothetical protein
MAGVQQATRTSKGDKKIIKNGIDDKKTAEGKTTEMTT